MALSQAEIDRLIEQVRQVARSIKGAEPDAPISIVFDSDLDRPAASFPGGVIKIRENMRDGDPYVLQRLILHEAAHQVVPDGSLEGHNQTWSDIFVGSAQGTFDKAGTDRVVDYINMHWEGQVDPQASLGKAAGGSPGRHSTGGDMMTFQEAVQALVDAGWSEANAQIIIAQELGPGGRVTPEMVERILSEPPGSGDRPAGQEVPADVQRQQDQDEAARAQRAREIAQVSVDNGPLSPEEQEFLEDPDNFELWRQELIAIAQDDQLNYDWVYNQLQIAPGTLDSTEALLQLYDAMADTGIFDKDDTLEDEEKVTIVQQVLAEQGGNALVQIAVRDWGMQTDNYLPDRRVEGVRLSDVDSMMEKYDMPFNRAVTVGQVANNYELSPEELAEIWSAQQGTAAIAAAVGGPQMASQFGMAQIASRYKEGLDVYEQSRVLARIHVLDPALAQKLKADPWSLDSGELRRVVDMLGGEEGAAEKAQSDPQADWILNRAAGLYNQVVRTPDEAGIKEAVQTLADAWNLTGFEDIAARVARQAIGAEIAAAKASLPNPFGGVQDPITSISSVDPLARAEELFRQTGEYQELFTHLAPGESEEEYVRRFENRSQQVLGDDIVSVVRNAMRSGNVNTVYQQGLLTDVGQSSTDFQELIARNAQVFREML